MKKSKQVGKRFEKRFSRMFDDYRQLTPKNVDKKVYRKLGELPISGEFKDFKMCSLLVAFDANNLYQTVMIGLG